MERFLLKCIMLHFLDPNKVNLSKDFSRVKLLSYIQRVQIGKCLQKIYLSIVFNSSSRTDLDVKTEFARGPGRGDTCHLSDLDETLPD